MHFEELIKKLQNEIKSNNGKMYDEDAKLRLQAVVEKYQGDDRMVSSKELAEEIRNEPPVRGYTTGVAELDDLIGSFRPGQLITIAGITKHGKTEFAYYLTRLFSEHHPSWFPLEVTARELIRRDIFERNLEPPLYFTPNHITRVTVDWLEQRVVEAVIKYNSKVFFIDHLDYIHFDDRNGINHSVALGNVVRGLKEIATRWNVVIVLMAHVTKVRENTPPTWYDMRGTASIGQESDKVLLIWRETTYDAMNQKQQNNNVLVSLVLNRQGDGGNVKMVFNRSDGTYMPMEWKPEYEQIAEEEDDRRRERREQRQRTHEEFKKNWEQD